jgi:1-deoxy-D-xylulose-5-phosphate reductoisomerase
MKKRVIVLGSTGSVGRNTLDVVRALGDEWEVAGLAAGSSYRELAEQARSCAPDAVALYDDGHHQALKHELNGMPCRVLTGSDALERMVVEVPCDCVVVAVVGVAALGVTRRAVELGRRIALANKEVLVVAGALLIPLAKRNGATILPVDSEHSAILQILHAGKSSEVLRVYLTASGGPFRTWSADRMEQATVEDALRHPTWDMGPKITIDSATMMNKALEIVEARWLFGFSPDRIGVVVHPESIIHSLVEFCDGSFIAQMGAPDMRTPIQYALTYPQRCPCPSGRLNLMDMRPLHLYPPDEERFPALRLGHEVAERGGTCGAVLNAANEAAVELFRGGAIRFPEVVRRVEAALRTHDYAADPTMEQLLAADHWARNEVTRCRAC